VSLLFCVRLFVVFTISPTSTLESTDRCSGELARTLCHYGTNIVLCKCFVIPNKERRREILRWRRL